MTAERPVAKLLMADDLTQAPAPPVAASAPARPGPRRFLQHVRAARRPARRRSVRPSVRQAPQQAASRRAAATGEQPARPISPENSRGRTGEQLAGPRRPLGPVTRWPGKVRVPFPVCLPGALHEKLWAAATRLGLKRGDVICELIARYGTRLRLRNRARRRASVRR
jgi:hypothetical protein